MVFYTMLLNLFTMFCFQCKSDSPKVTMKRNGTMVTVVQTCSKYLNKPFIWRSQPYVLGRYPAGNILFSFAVLVAGASVLFQKDTIRHSHLMECLSIIFSPSISSMVLYKFNNASQTRPLFLETYCSKETVKY